MLIIHRTAQLGVVGQKRPQVWQSHIMPVVVYDSLVTRFQFGSESRVTTIADDYRVHDAAVVSLSLGNHVVRDLTHITSKEEELKTWLSVGDHRLVELAKLTTSDEAFKVSLGLGDKHKLYYWGVTASVLDEDHVKTSLLVGNHKIYEEE